MRHAAFILTLIALVLLAGVARCWPLRETFIEGQIYFADPDCYSRMTRAGMIASGDAVSIRRHDFENYPQGITPHTTAPMDLAIVTLAKIFDAGFRLADSRSVLRGQSLDLAGALIGPLIGMLTCLVLALLLARVNGVSRAASLSAGLVFAVSPIAVHGTMLGRPDHQALLLALLAGALVAELRLVEKASRAVALASGVMWGVALWVSLYEPLVLFAATLAGLAWARPAAFRERERWLGWLVTAGIFASSVALDGWRMRWPDPALREAFFRWSASIGELQSLDLRGLTLWRWLGAACALVPLALAWQWRRPAAHFALLLLLAVFVLTLWQVRWGYFLALVFAVALPLALSAAPRAWLGWVIFVVGLWPIARDWDERLFPSAAEERRRETWRIEQMALRAVAQRLREEPSGAFLAPWWVSPALAYWSGVPGVAGSSHESLPGILDSAHFYLAVEPDPAAEVLRARRVRWVVGDEAERVVNTSAQILGAAPSAAEPLGYLLEQRPQQVPPWLARVDWNAKDRSPSDRYRIAEIFRLYRVVDAKLPP